MIDKYQCGDKVTEVIYEYSPVSTVRRPQSHRWLYKVQRRLEWNADGVSVCRSRATWL